MTNGEAGPAPPSLDAPEYRVEGSLKVTGQATYVGDLERSGMLWAAFYRSDLPHARILSIDVEAARASAGVHAVLTAADIGRARFGRKLLDQPVLADDRVRFVGERVVAVAAESRQAATRAAQKVRVEYEELPVVFDPFEALNHDAPLLHDRAEEYVYLGGERPSLPHRNLQGRLVIRKGAPEIEAVFANAHRVFEHDFSTPRQHQAYLEAHATLVWFDEAGIAHVASTNKSPFLLRAQMAAALGRPPEEIDIDSGFIGGDFGGKGYSPDEYACYFLALATGRPVKAVMSYVDEFAAANPRHDSAIRLRTAVDKQGGFLAHEARVIFNGGAYASAKPLPGLVLAGGVHTLAAYRVPNVFIEQLTVYTNTAPGGHMRSPGEVQALFAGESHVDMIARELGRDPLEFRLSNALQQSDLGLGGERYHQVRTTEVLSALAEGAAWATPLAPNRGRGVAIGRRHIGGGRCVVQVALHPDGLVRSITGMADQGGGSHTVIQRVIASGLSIPESDVLIERASTGRAPYDPGAGASRLTHISSQAAASAATALKDRIEEAANGSFGANGGISLVDGYLVGGALDIRLSLRDAAAAIVPVDGVIAAEGTYEAGPDHGDDPEDVSFAGYVVEVEVDRETGELTILRAWLAADVGAIINPVAHQGQLEGGFVFGLGGAILEDLPLDDGRVQTLSFADYKIPTSADIPPLTTILLPASRGPGAFGAKMVGELSNSAVAPAIANAVADAVGVRLFDLPITSERIFAGLRSGGG